MGCRQLKGKLALSAFMEHVFVCIIVLLFMVILAALSLNLSIFSPFRQAFDDFSITDVYYTIQRTGNNVEWSNDITIVDITDQHSRSDIARTLTQVAECKPKQVVIDLIFALPGEQPLADDSLVRAIDALPDKVLAMKLTDYDPEKSSFTACVHSFFCPPDAPYNGFVNLPKSINSGVLRTFSMFETLQADTVQALAPLACSKSGLKTPSLQPRERIIAFNNVQFPVVRYDSIAQLKGLLTGKIVFVGAVHEESDMHITPIGKRPGTEIQAHIMQTCISHPHIKTTGTWFSVCLAALLCLLSAWIGHKIQKRFPLMYLYWLQGYYFLLSALLVWIGFICYVKFDLYIKMTIPFVAMALVEQARLHYKWLISYGKAHPEKKWLSRLTQKSIYA